MTGHADGYPFEDSIGGRTTGDGNDIVTYDNTSMEAR